MNIRGKWFSYKLLRTNHGRLHAAWKVLGSLFVGRVYISNTRWDWPPKHKSKETPLHLAANKIRAREGLPPLTPAQIDNFRLQWQELHRKQGDSTWEYYV